MLDIDGTLAPIAPTPGHAVVPSETKSVLSSLVKLPGVHVGFVSGRSVTDAWRMMEIERAWVIGNHGFEIRSPDGEVTNVAESGDFENAIQAAATALAPIARETPGALVENKHWTLTLHYRLVEDRLVAGIVARTREIARKLGLRVTEGKKVVELRPLIDINKGSAALAFANRVGALRNGSTLYAGDDQTDEDAFRVLRNAMADAVTVRVLGLADDQVGDTDAEFTLASTEELRQVLAWLVAQKGPRPGEA
jgi:trehalose-phosphatase